MTDVGKSLFCRVTATNASGSASADSNTVGPVAAAPAGGSTWDPANKTADMELSGGNTIATVDDTAVFAYQQVRGTASRNAGKKYFEVTIDTTVNLSAAEMIAFVGLADDTHAIGTVLPGSGNSKGFSLKLSETLAVNLKTDTDTAVFGGTTATDNDIIGIACDLDAKVIEGVYKNGSLLTVTTGAYPISWNDAGAPASATVFIHTTMQWQGIGPCSLILNTAGPFALGTLPSGYSAWG